jgi:[1-hydroxy-2-(trimethylamino)ethyl]phosphonate dioxygenase
MNNTVLHEIVWLFDMFRDETCGEIIPIPVHCLQAAYLAEKEGAPASLIAACLLHDIDLLLALLRGGDMLKNIEAMHGVLGAKYLEPHFAPEVTEPVRLHVPAKGYWAAQDETYRDRLSEASQKSLVHQGGVFDEAHMSAFRQEKYWHVAVQVRGWDDRAKVPDMETPPLRYFIQTYLTLSHVWKGG